MVVVGRTNRPEPKRPVGGGWVFAGRCSLPMPSNTIADVFELATGERAISSVDLVEVSAERSELQFHVSISGRIKRGVRKRPDALLVAAAVRAFGMTEAEEDNHHPGVARNFYLPVDRRTAEECECKANEKPHDEGDGFVWREQPEWQRGGSDR